MNKMQLSSDCDESQIIEHAKIVVKIIEPVIQMLKEFKRFAEQSVTKFGALFGQFAAYELICWDFIISIVFNDDKCYEIDNNYN